MLTHKDLGANTKYIGSVKVCRRCLCEVFEYYYENPHVDNNDILCSACKCELTPPKLHLSIMIEHGIWNVTQSRWEKQMTIKDLQMCGWFVRKIVKKTATVRHVSKDLGEEQIYLEFFGNIKCLRVRHKYYPVRLGVCGEQNCILQPIGG